MEFDRKGPEGGLEIYTSIENGKAYLEYKVYLCKGMAEEMLETTEEVVKTKFLSIPPRGAYLDICIRDREGRIVFAGYHPLDREELAKGLLLHPHLWQGPEDPYLYQVRVSLMENKDYAVDVLDATFAFRTFCEIPMKGWFLNGRPFQVKAVGYEIPDSIYMGCKMDGELRSMSIRRDLEWIRQMGANTVCPVKGKIDREFWQICDEMGLLLWWQDREDFDIPLLYGTPDSLLTLRGHSPTDRYYYYKACWSKEAFVYLSADSLMFQPNGNARVVVYSNQKKVALYVDGTLFEFKTEGPDFLFQEIPVKKLPLMLAAEAEECGMAITAYPFTKNSQIYHFSMTNRE